MKYQLPDYKTIRGYVIQHFLLNYEISDFSDLFLDNFHIPFEGDYVAVFNNLENIVPHFYTWNKFFFPVFFYDTNLQAVVNNKKLSFDFYLNTFLLLSGWQENYFTNRDLHGRFRFADSLQARFNFIEVPVVNIYFRLMADLIRQSGINVEEKKSRGIVITHDIDTVANGWWEDCGYFLKKKSLKSFIYIPLILLKKVLFRKDSYFTALLEMAAFEKKNGIKSIYFFLVNKSKQDADYNISDKKIQKIIFNLFDSGCEVQLHPGYETYNNLTELRKQIELLSSVIHMPVEKVRQHFLRIEVEQTFLLYEQLGIKEDYTLGFAEKAGFRHSVATPFYPFLFSQNRASTVLEVPLYFMDGTLVHYSPLNKRDEEGKKVLDSINIMTENFNVGFSVIFHNTSFSNLKYLGLKELYQRIIAVRT